MATLARPISISFAALSLSLVLYICATCVSAMGVKPHPISGSYASLDTADLYYPIILAAQLFDESISPLPSGQGGGVCPKDVVLHVDSNKLKLPTGLTSSNCPSSPALIAQEVLVNKYELKDLDDEEVYTAEIPWNLFKCVNDTERPFTSARVTTLKTHIGSRLRATFRQLLIPDFVLDKALGMVDIDNDIKDEREQVLEMWNSTYINHIISGVQLAVEDLEDYYVLVLNREQAPDPKDESNSTTTTASNGTDTDADLLKVSEIEAEANTTIDDSTDPFGVVRQILVRQLSAFTPTDAISATSGCAYIYEIKAQDDDDYNGKEDGDKDKDKAKDKAKDKDEDKNTVESMVTTAVTVNDDVSAKMEIEILVPLLLPLFGHSRWSNMPIPSLSLYPTESRCSKSTNSTHSTDDNSGIEEMVMAHQPEALKAIVQVKDFDSWFTISVNGNACSSAKFNTLLETEYFKTSSLHGENKYTAEAFAIAGDTIQFLEDHRTAVRSNRAESGKSELARLYPVLSQKILDTLAKASIFVGRVDLGQCFNVINRRTLEIILLRRSSYFLRCTTPTFPRIPLEAHICALLETPASSTSTDAAEWSAFFIQPHAPKDCVFSSKSTTAETIRLKGLLPTMDAETMPSEEPYTGMRQPLTVSVGPAVPPK